MGRSSNRVTVSGKLTRGRDDALIAKWNAIPKGQRNQYLKDLLAGGGQVAVNRLQAALPLNFGVDTSGALEDLRGRIDWIAQAINDMPGYLENVITHVAANAPPAVSGAAPPGAVDSEKLARRKANIAKQSW